jgi:hypothetical protein
MEFSRAYRCSATSPVLQPLADIKAAAQNMLLSCKRVTRSSPRRPRAPPPSPHVCAHDGCVSAESQLLLAADARALQADHSVESEAAARAASIAGWSWDLIKNAPVRSAYMRRWRLSGRPCALARGQRCGTGKCAAAVQGLPPPTTSKPCRSTSLSPNAAPYALLMGAYR